MLIIYFLLIRFLLCVLILLLISFIISIYIYKELPLHLNGSVGVSIYLIRYSICVFLPRSFWISVLSMFVILSILFCLHSSSPSPSPSSPSSSSSSSSSPSSSSSSYYYYDCFLFLTLLVNIIRSIRTWSKRETNPVLNKCSYMF